MPLKPGYSRKTVSGNIKREVESGRPPDQAAAMSYKSARKSAKKAGKSTASLRKKK